MDVVQSKRSNKKILNSSAVFQIIIYLVAGIAAFITLWPFIYVLSMSISDPEQVLSKSVWLFPIGLSFEAYEKIAGTTMMWQSFRNSVLYTASGTLLNLISAVLAAYPLSRKNLFARKFFVAFLIIPMYFSGGLIPYFILVTRIGLYNNMLCMIILGAVSIWNIILVRTYFSTLPYSLQESAIIEGANDFQVLFKIIVPLSKPILAVIALYSAVGIWNSWFNALLFLPNARLQPLQMYLAKVLVFDANILKSSGDASTMKALIRNSGVLLQMKYAIIIFCSLPIICLYPFLQKYFIKGALLGSLKE